MFITFLIIALTTICVVYLFDTWDFAKDDDLYYKWFGRVMFLVYIVFLLTITYIAIFMG